MNNDELNIKIIGFFETIDKYYGCKTEVSEGLFSSMDDVDAEHTTWSLSEFDLVQSAYRKKGLKFMMEGKNRYYEVSADKIINFKQPGRHKYEFIEQYSETVFRITKIRFHSKY